MDRKRKVGFAAIFLSNRYFLNEISVEGKTTSKFYFRIAHYDQYAAQIIRTGNCITLLTTNISLTDDSFWNTNYFEDLTKFVFWTFNKSFLLKITEKVESLKLSILDRCLKLLKENFVPYGKEPDDSTDEELLFCFRKNGNLKRDPKFDQMYQLDKENRAAILLAVEKRINELSKTLTEPESPKPLMADTEFQPPADTVSFLNVLKPLNNNPTETLNFITAKLEEAKFEIKLLSKVHKLPNGKNPYGLNGAIAAMIDFFFQHNYFKKEYNLEEIFKAYTGYTGNSIAKLKPFLSEFRQDNSYIKHFEKLKQLKISKLK